MNCPSVEVPNVSAIPELLDPEFGRDPNQQPSLLPDKEVARILRMTIEWVHRHAEEIPGFERLGQYFRFRSVAVGRWLGTMEPLLMVDEVGKRLGVPPSWVYANADQVPGVIRLGRYVRFRPRILNVWLSGSEACQ